MTDESTHVLLIEDNPGDADLVRLRLTEGKRVERPFRKREIQPV